MKRSEMYQQMKSCYNEYIEDYGSNYVIDKMLQRMENKGMLPPYNNSGLSNYDIAMGSNINKWEPETDERGYE